MTKEIAFEPSELADLYCLKTLYDYYMPIKPGSIELYFTNEDNSEVNRSSLTSLLGKDAIIKEEMMSQAFVSVVAYSDNYIYSKRKSESKRAPHILEIDQLILKNSIEPLTQEEKQQLREKYRITTQKPMTVIWTGRCPLEVEDELTEEIAVGLEKHSSVYIFNPSLNLKDNISMYRPARKDIHYIKKFGILKDFFAMADIAIYSDNLYRQIGPMHNFVEATEGGPLFIIPPSYKQFGLKSLENEGVVRCFPHFDLLKDTAVQYAKEFSPSLKEEHSAKRSAHLNKTRKKYMPVVTSVLENLLYQAEPIQKSDLLIYEEPIYGTDKIRRRIMHPETRWKNHAWDSLGNILKIGK